MTEPHAERAHSQADRRTTERTLIYAVFFASGMAGLIYQVVWSRMLTLVIGVSIFAVTTVVCTFMGGLALGSYTIGRWVGRSRDPLLVYGMFEAIIGIYAALTPWIFQLAEPAYAWAFAHLSPAALGAFRILLSAAILLLPTALMGGTLPLLSRALWLVTGREASAAGLLYATNTFGAVAGCLGAGFLLLATLGVRGSLLVSAALNFGVALAVVLLRRNAGVPARQETPAVAKAAVTEPSTGEARLVLLVFFVSGIAALGYEVLWTRALLVYLKASTYAFSLMLSVYLLGVALGSLVASRPAARSRAPLRGIAICQIGIAASVAAGMMIFPHVDELGRFLSGAERLDSFGRSMALMFAQAALVLFVPTVFMGAMFPYGIAAYRSSGELGGRVGAVYAVNTTGNIVGSIGVGFFAIGWIGVRHSMVILIGLNLAAAALVMLWRRRRPVDRVGWPLAAAAGFVLVLWAIPPGVFFRTMEGPGTKILFYREGASDTVAVIERVKQGDRTLIYSDGRGAAGTQSLPWNLYFGHLPMLLHPDPREVLHICYGSGNSVLALTRHDPDRIDVVELSPHVRDASEYFWTNEKVLEDPRVDLIIEDGRNFVLGSDRTYDVISLEPPNIYTAGVVNLYTKEFYELARERLREGGLMLQWLPTIQLSIEDRGRLIRAFTEVFPHVTVWQQLVSPTILLLGSLEPLQVDIEEVDRRMASPAMRQDVARMGVGDALGLLSLFLLDDAQVRELVKDYAPVEDDRTVVDYSIPRFAGSGYGFSIFTLPVGEDRNEPARIARARAAEYADWRGDASSLVADPAQARRLDAAIRFRQRHGRPGSRQALQSAGLLRGGSP